MIDIKDINKMYIKLKGKDTFVKKYETIKEIISIKEYNLTDVIHYMINLIIEKNEVNKKIIKELSKLELKTYNNLDNDLIICSLIGTFVLLK